MKFFIFFFKWVFLFVFLVIMGGLISFFCDIKIVYKDFKVILKFFVRIVVKVYGIVDDVE